MGRIIDRFLLFIYSLAMGTLSFYVLYFSLTWLKDGRPSNFMMLPLEYWVRNTLIIISIIALLISIRFIYISLRRSQSTAPSIDQKTDYGDIRISIATVENLSLRSASKVKGVHDLKARVNVSHAGLQITIRAVVDGEVSIPDLTEEVQRTVKGHLEETTGIPVSDVSVFVANIVQTQTFKSRVE
jgi:uncharacterized alkaline shock family protein YloU